jgi:hypothetical protein
MIRAIAVLTLSLCADGPSKAQEKREEIRFLATVQSVVLSGKVSGKVIRVGVDAHFILTLRLDSSVPALKDFVANNVVTFAIHSPSVLFHGQPPEGKRYEFLLRCKTEKKELSCSWFEARESPLKKKEEVESNASFKEATSRGAS